VDDASAVKSRQRPRQPDRDSATFLQPDGWAARKTRLKQFAFVK